MEGGDVQVVAVVLIVQTMLLAVDVPGALQDVLLGVKIAVPEIARARVGQDVAEDVTPLVVADVPILVVVVPAQDVLTLATTNVIIIVHWPVQIAVSPHVFMVQNK